MREPFNTISHLIGAILVLVGTACLVMISEQNTTAVTTFLVFGAASAFLYISSAVYHWTKDVSPNLQKMDHSAIYLMIAGSYTPLSMITLAGPIGTVVLVLQWTLALIGIVVTLILSKPPIWIRLVLYLVMGWMALPFVAQITAKSTPWAVIWLFGGGIFYTVGVVIYASKKPDLLPEKFGYHGLWHLFVMAGTACHFLMMRELV